MLAKIEWWRKELSSWIKAFVSLHKQAPLPPVKILCTVTFLYSVKGIVGSGRDKKETVFAWVEEGVETHQCIRELFNPVGIGKGQCVVHDVIVLAIPTVNKVADE